MTVTKEATDKDKAQQLKSATVPAHIQQSGCLKLFSEDV